MEIFYIFQIVWIVINPIVTYVSLCTVCQIYIDGFGEDNTCLSNDRII